jgi:glucose-1-phosphatase
MNIRNIIFDLGGVLLNINYEASIDAFKRLGVRDFDSFFTQAAQNQLFDRLDRGEVSPAGFRQELRDLSGFELKDADIDSAWNAMLLDLPKARVQLLKGVRQHYNTYLLSNTNAIHYPAYMKYMRQAYGVESLEDLFNKQYLSHEIGLRKPDPEPFELILRENNLKAGETLFIDDTLGHVKGAAKTGIKAFFLDVKTMDVIDLFGEDCRLKAETLDQVFPDNL